MTIGGYNLPDDVSTRDIPGFRPQDEKRNAAFDQADSDVNNGCFDSDDLIAATKLASVNDWKSIKESIVRNDAKDFFEAITCALRDHLAEEILRGDQP